MESGRGAWCATSWAPRHRGLPTRFVDAERSTKREERRRPLPDEDAHLSARATSSAFREDTQLATLKPIDTTPAVNKWSERTPQFRNAVNIAIPLVSCSAWCLAMSSMGTVAPTRIPQLPDEAVPLRTG
ncbi:hypothetical protein GCM10020366_07590 [Saccharopolyspora gregorii]|uniref:Uncharacterized protein n=1 Tax=Saccharopolyspora gregorii TaxID=33914 RepID=A0ABP6RHS1_9PSEU